MEILPVAAKILSIAILPSMPIKIRLVLPVQPQPLVVAARLDAEDAQGQDQHSQNVRFLLLVGTRWHWLRIPGVSSSGGST